MDTPMQETVPDQNMQAAPPAAAPAPQQSGAPAPKMKMPGRKGKKLVIAAVAIIIVAAIGYYVYSNYIGASGSQLYQALSSKSLNLTAVQSIVLNRIHSGQTFSASYAGQAVLNTSGAAASGISLGAITFTIPFTLSYMRYGSSTRKSLVLTDIPILGNLGVVVISNGSSGGYVCTNSSISSLFTQNTTSGYSCTPNGQQSASELGNLSTSLSGILNSVKLNLSLTGIGVSSYAGMPCYEVKASGNATANQNLTSSLGGLPLGTPQSNKPEHMSVATCFSAAYDVPLNGTITITGANQSAITLAFHETQIGGSVAQGNVTSLPGPIANGTASLSATSTTTIPSTTIPTQLRNATIQSIIGSNSSVGYQTLEGMIQQRFEAGMSQYNATYALGSAYGSNGNTTSYSTNNQTIAKYYDNVSLSSVNIYSYGALGFAYFYLGPSKQYYCSASSPAQSAEGLNYSCYAQNPPQNISFYYNDYEPIGLELQFVPLSTVARVLGQRTYDGQACTMLSGTNSSYQATLPGSINITFSTCISNQYSIPLNFTVADAFDYTNGQSSTSTQSMVLSSFSDHTTYAEVSGLPGPVTST